MGSDRRVAVLDCLFMLDHGRRLTYDGGNRYLVNLHKILVEMGYEPHVWQASGTTSRSPTSPSAAKAWAA